MADMSDFQKVDDAQMYRISEVAKLTGHSSRTLRRWVVSGYLEGARRDGVAPRSPFVVPGAVVNQLLREKTQE
jgi:hypothetical protein